MAAKSSSPQQQPQTWPLRRKAMALESLRCWWFLLSATRCHLGLYFSRLPFMTSARGPKPRLHTLQTRLTFSLCLRHTLHMGKTWKINV